MRLWFAVVARACLPIVHRQPRHTNKDLPLAKSHPACLVGAPNFLDTFSLVDMQV